MAAEIYELRKVGLILLALLGAACSQSNAGADEQEACAAVVPHQTLRGPAPIGSFQSLVENHCFTEVRARVIVGAMLPLHNRLDENTRSCKDFAAYSAVQMTEAVLHTTKTFSLRWDRLFNQSRSALPWVGLNLRDTCNSVQGTSLAMYDIPARSVSWMLTERFSAPVNSSLLCRATSCFGSVLAVVGPESSQDVDAVTHVLSSLAMPHVSFWSTKDTWTSKTHPYLFRTVPMLRHQVRLVVDFVEKFHWRYVAFLSSSDFDYGRAAYSIYLSQMRQAGLLDNCVAVHLTFSASNTSSWAEVRDQLKDHPQATGVIMFSTELEGRLLLSNLSAEDPALVRERVWLVSDQVAAGLEYLVNQQKFGAFESLSLLMIQPVSDWFISRENDIDIEQRFKDIFEKPQLSNFEKNPYLVKYWENAYNCQLNLADSIARCDPANKNYQACDLRSPPHDYPRNIYPRKLRSVFAASKVLFEAIERALAKRLANTSNLAPYDCKELLPGQHIRDELRNISYSLPCSSPLGFCPVVNVFTEDQDGQPIFTIDYFRNGSMLEQFASYSRVSLDGKGPPKEPFNFLSVFPGANFTGRSLFLHGVPPSLCSSACPAGTERTFSSRSRCCWSCTKCTENSFSNGTNSQRCLPCPVGSLSTGTSCGAVALTYADFKSNWSTVILSVTVLVFLAISATIVCYLVNYNEFILRAGNIRLSLVTLVTLLISMATIPLLFVRPSSAICKTALITATLPVMFTSALLLTKTARLAIVVYFSHRLQKVTGFWTYTTAQLLVAVSLTLIGMLIIGVGMTIDTPIPKVIVVSFETVHLVCRWTTTWNIIGHAYTLALLTAAAILAFFTRNLPNDYNEAKLIWMATTVSCLAWIGLAPTLFIEQGKRLPFFLSFLILAHNSLLWGFIFLPRIFNLFQSRSKRTKIALRTACASKTSCRGTTDRE